jgi:hypothetical protein
MPAGYTASIAAYACCLLWFTLLSMLSSYVGSHSMLAKLVGMLRCLFSDFSIYDVCLAVYAGKVLCLSMLANLAVRKPMLAGWLAGCAAFVRWFAMQSKLAGWLRWLYSVAKLDLLAAGWLC